MGGLVPGAESSVREAARTWHTAAHEQRDAGSDLPTAGAADWQGSGAEAFTRQRASTAAELSDLARIVEAGAGILEQFASALAGARDRADDARAGLDDTNWDASTVQQGSLGDCYLLATLMSSMRTDTGDTWLKQNVRWDAQKNGYWVTLYVGGQAKQYFVDAVYEQGVYQDDGGWWIFDKKSHNVVSLYEAAVAQAITFGDLDDGGFADQAMELVTGRPAEQVTNGSSGSDPAALAGVLGNGGAVVANTNHETALTGVQVVRPDGSTTTTDVQIVGSHAYCVEKVDADGNVWVRNPWGPGNSADGGGLVRLSSSQFRRAFSWLAVQK